MRIQGIAPQAGASCAAGSSERSGSRSRKMKRRRKGRQELKRRDPGRTVALCGPCHRNVHVSIGNTDLARGYDSVEALRDHPGVRRFTEWVKDKPHGRA
jgi:hypothetical protein